jgi:hypothetical protein
MIRVVARKRAFVFANALGTTRSTFTKIDNRGMARDLPHRFRQQLFSRWNFVPRRRAGRMRQRDKIKNLSGAMHPRFATDHLI